MILSVPSKAFLRALKKRSSQKESQNATIEDVAREASVSKGGVLHHFPNKEAILVGLLQDLISRFEAAIESYRSQDPDSKGAFTRAFLRATIKPEAQCVDLFSALSSVLLTLPCCSICSAKAMQNGSNRWKTTESTQSMPRLYVSRRMDFGSPAVHGMGIPSEKIRQSIIDKLLALTHGKTLPK